jgi:hypothetical protein
VGKRWIAQFCPYSTHAACLGRSEWDAGKPKFASGTVRHDPNNRVGQLPGLDSIERKPFFLNGNRVLEEFIAHTLPTFCTEDPDLAAVVDAWPTLPEAIKAGILATVKAARG